MKSGYIDYKSIPKHLIKTDKRMEVLEKVSLKRQCDLTVILENVHDAHNISACIRSCDAVGIHEIHVVHTIAPKPYRRLGKKTSAGSVKWVKVNKWKTLRDCFSSLKEKEFTILTTGLGIHSKSLYEIDFTRKLALVFGNEHDGVSGEAIELADGNFNVPQQGMIESLNISVACAVSLFEAMRQKSEADHYNPDRKSIEQHTETFVEILGR